MAIHIVNMNPSIDELIRIEDGSPGGVWTELESVEFPAGKGFNCAAALNQLGAPCRVVCFCGEDRVDAFKWAFGPGVRVECVVLKERTRKNLTIVNESGGLVGHVRRRGFQASDERLRELSRLLLAGARPGDQCLVTGGLPGGVTRGAAAAFIACVRDAGCETAFDGDLRLIKDAGLRGLFLVKPNLAELQAVCEAPLTDRLSVAEAARHELGAAARYAVASMGGKGAVLIDGHSGERWFGRLPEADPGRVNPTGCGDAMAAGLLSARLENASSEAMFARGLACGYANLFAPRPGRMDMERYRWALSNVSLERSP